MRNAFQLALALGLAAGVSLAGQTDPRTEITKWQDGREAAVAITYDDSTINQFRVALPMMNERGLVGTFFVITAQIPGSTHMPMFVGRPIMEIVRESATVLTSAANVYERTSMLRYLAEIQRNEIALASRTQPANLASVDTALAKLRESGQTLAAGAVPYVPVRSEEAQSGRPRADEPGGLSWDEMRKVAAQGHEIASHSISHARMTVLDEANILYEVEKARDELREKMGEKHTFSLESPFGIRDEHSRRVLISRFDLVRNWVHDMDAEYMDGYMRGNNTDPAASTKPYLEWERGPVSATTIDQMKGWVDKSLQTGAWLVLVIHGVNGLGYEPLATDNVRAYFDYMKAKVDSGQLWVATYQDGVKYVRERMRSEIKTEPAGAGIRVTVTHPLDPRKYDVPLTARTTVPAGWTSARVTQGGVSATVAVHPHAGGPYVQYRVKPNGGPVSLTRVNE